MVNKTEILKDLAAGKNCAMIVFSAFADLLGFDTDETDAIAACFGGGMHKGSVCGAVTGAYMALGAYAKDTPEGNRLGGLFDERFKARFGSVFCRDLLGYDVSVPGEKEKAAASGAFTQICPDYISAAIEILEEMIGEGA